MKKIILASGSPQRKKLLKAIGLPFTVRPSKVNEKHQITTTCASLVKHNALLKAQDVASRLKDGVVIGADTVVIGGRKRLIGKPKTHQEAKKILREMCAHPHWVYTGVAVVDARTGQKRVGYERTKVFMQKLSDAEMDAYHKETTPLDKAGGFDIEGRGGLFIHRIEGCYANVIGLPMARLRVMFKDFGISVL